MRLSNEEAYEIICAIKRNCEEFNDCSDCPFFSSDGDCAVSAEDVSPIDWVPTPPTKYKVLA